MHNIYIIILFYSYVIVLFISNESSGFMLRRLDCPSIGQTVRTGDWVIWQWVPYGGFHKWGFPKMDGL